MAKENQKSDIEYVQKCCDVFSLWVKEKAIIEALESYQNLDECILHVLSTYNVEITQESLHSTLVEIEGHRELIDSVEREIDAYGPPATKETILKLLKEFKFDGDEVVYQITFNGRR